MTLRALLRAAVYTIALAAFHAGAAGCGESTAPAANVPFSQTDLRVGGGAAAASGNTLVVEYTGWLYDSTRTDDKGLQFDTSAGRAPLEFVLGQGQVIEGWDRGLVGLRVGGVRRLVIPPSLAYGGEVRQGVIPPHAGLVFDVELVEIKTP